MLKLSNYSGLSFITMHPVKFEVIMCVNQKISLLSCNTMWIGSQSPHHLQ